MASNNIQNIIPIHAPQLRSESSISNIATSSMATTVSLSAAASTPNNQTIISSPTSFRATPASATSTLQRGTSSSVSSTTSVSTVESSSTSISHTTSHSSNSSISGPSLLANRDVNKSKPTALSGKLPRATLEQKIQVIDYYHRLKLSQVDVVEQYKDKLSILTSSLSDWIKNEHELRSRLTLSNKNLRRKVKFKYEKINHAMDLLVQSFQANNKPINEPILREYWSIYAHQYGVDNPRRLVGFSHGWLMQFKKRHGLFKRKKYQPSVNPLDFPKVENEDDSSDSKTSDDSNGTRILPGLSQQPYLLPIQVSPRVQNHNGLYLPNQQNHVHLPLQLPLPQRLLVWPEYQTKGNPTSTTPNSVHSQSLTTYSHHIQPHHAPNQHHHHHQIHSLPGSYLVPGSGTPIMHPTTNQYSTHGFTNSILSSSNIPIPSSLGVPSTPGFPKTPSQQYPISFPQIQYDFNRVQSTSPIPSNSSTRVNEGNEEEMVNSQGEVIKMRLDNIINHHE
ncbi:uncharacterized protein KQ657_000196 [Scheffersomyces spartinae]|uniref:HTH CENPB-type domain-containing protein n=1 Tax=Scheffersomyces spartinae TaxID=45513 RepID=A0A9P7VE40_9ASCO|nr:uncharacterized protein KQ657_000196 [Scheffersomyces spartinae]KAG7196184.1 hypothetical protein KQ657_000196 [Scheffersomyces spartinae]